MKYSLQISCLMLAAVSPLAASGSGFVAPDAYPVNRYEAGWLKNPFTLKTAPPAIVKESFAKDLVLSGAYKHGSIVTIYVLNSKTREHLTVSSDKPATNGMTLKSADVTPDKKNTTAEVELGGEVATLKYDETVLKQLVASSQSASNAATVGLNGARAPQPPIPQPLQNNAQNGRAGAAPAPPYPYPSQPSHQTNLPQPMNNMSAPARRRILTAPNPVH